MVKDMKLDEVMEMAYPSKYVEHIIIGLEEPLNQHLVTLVAFDFPPDQRPALSSKLLASLSAMRTRSGLRRN